jgi:hypothetical protein
MNSHLSRFGSTVKERATPAWRAAAIQAERAWQWLMPRRQTVCWAAGIGISVVVLIGFLSHGGAVWLWTKYSTHQPAIAPLLTLLAGVAVAGVALLRHFAQTEADRQRRITESFSKAIEQLGSDKVEVRLGGIYSLERISKESPNDYWTIMEALTAFVRERSQRTEAERTERITQRAYFLWIEAGRPEGIADFFWTNAERREPPPTDIAAVLTVLKRRSEWGRKRETANNWRLDLRGAILRGANLREAHLEGAFLDRAHLEGAFLVGAHLEAASLADVHLEGAILLAAHLERAFLDGAHLERAILEMAHLERAILNRANLRGASLHRVHLEGAILDSATRGLERAILSSTGRRVEAFGDGSDTGLQDA